MLLATFDLRRKITAEQSLPLLGCMVKRKPQDMCMAILYQIEHSFKCHCTDLNLLVPIVSSPGYHPCSCFTVKAPGEPNPIPFIRDVFDLAQHANTFDKTVGINLYLVFYICFALYFSLKFVNVNYEIKMKSTDLESSFTGFMHIYLSDITALWKVLIMKILTITIIYFTVSRNMTKHNF